MSIRTLWVRTCQECMKKNVTKQPDLTDRQERWRDLACKHCKSEGTLDFGTEREWNEVTKKWVYHNMEEDGTYKQVESDD